MGWIFNTRVNKDGTQALMYQVKYRGDKFNILTGVKCKRKNFTNGRVKGALADVNIKLGDLERITLKAIEEGKAAFPQWTIEYLGLMIEARRNGSPETGKARFQLKDYWDKLLKVYTENKQRQHVRHNENSQLALFKFIDQDIYLDEITLDHLNYAKQKLLVGRSPSTVHGYFADLRIVIKDALVKKLIKDYPFLGFRMPPLRKKINIALTLAELRKFAKAKCSTPYMEMVRDMAMFRYYCLGMRIGDQLRLTKANIKGEYIDYWTHKNTHHFFYKMKPQALKIIKKYISKHHYIFPILNPKFDEEEQEHQIELIRKSFRQTLYWIAKAAGIDKPINNHVFRHTWNFINSGHMDLETRRGGLGHKKQSTTEDYDRTMPNLDKVAKGTKT